MKKRILSCLMALALCMTLLPTAALAEGEPAEVSAADALIAALADSTKNHIKLMADIEISAMLTVNRTVTLDLNDHVLKMTGTGRVIEVKNGVNLTLVDNAETKTEKYFNKDSTGLWTLATGTTENTVNGGVITGGNTDAGSYGGGVEIVSGGAFTMNGGNIVGCTAHAGGGVYVEGTFTMTGGSIAGCVATTGSGGGVLVNAGGTFVMSGGSIAGCTAASKFAGGGGISNAGTTTLSGSAKIQNCRVSYNGYGGGIESAGALTVNGNVEITDCMMGTIPDAMYFENGTVSGGRFDGVVTKLGGTIIGGTFDDKVTNQGGTISDGTFNGRVVNEDNIENGMFNGEVFNQSKGTIKNGSFSGTVTNNKGGTISGGMFTETSTVNNNGTIGGGTFSSTVTNNGTINGGTFAVTFDTKGGNNVPVENVLNGQKATKPADPTRAGYTFGGWYTEEACTNPYGFATPVTNALTLYAKWTINQYTITFKPGNGDEDTTITQNYGTPVTAPANPTRTGYTFAGWDKEIPAAMPAENMTVTAQWTAVGSGSSGGGSSSGGSSSSSKPSTSTGTTTKPDGTKVQTETKPDGTTIKTETKKDGTVTKTETKKDGSSVTENKAADGSTGTVKTDKNGQTTAETALSSKAIETAKRNGEPVKAPVEVKASKNSSTAPTVKVELPKGAGETKVEIPISNVKPGTVAILVHADGTEEIVKNSLPTEDGIQLTVNGGATVKIVDNSKGFIDTQDHWAKDAIDFVCTTPLGKAADSCPCEGDGGDLEIGFNDHYLSDALKAAPADELNVCLNTGSSPCIFVPADGSDNFVYMVLPVRLRAGQ